MLTNLHYDHFSNAKCRTLFLYICFCFVVFYILRTQHVEMHFLLHIFTSGVVSYPTVKKTPFQTTPYLKFSCKSYTFFSHFLPIQIHVLSDLSISICSENNTLLLSFPDAHANPRNIWVGPLGGYRESLWNALLVCRRFQQSKVHLVHQVQLDFRWPVAVFSFYSGIRFFFNVFRITYRQWIYVFLFFFHKYSLNCMALFSCHYLWCFFFPQIVTEMHGSFCWHSRCVHWQLYFLKDRETSESVIKGKQLHTLSSL